MPVGWRMRRGLGGSSGPGGDCAARHLGKKQELSQVGGGHPGDGFILGVRIGGRRAEGNTTPPPLPSASSCRNPNRKTVSPAASRCISRKPWGIICICQKTLSLQLFHPEFLQARPLAAGARGSPGTVMGMAGRGGGSGRAAAPGAPGAPGGVTDQTPRENSVSPIGFERRGEPRRWGRGKRDKAVRALETLPHSIRGAALRG